LEHVERAKGRLTVHEVVKRDDGSFALFVNRKLHAATRSAMTNDRIKLDPLVNQLVRFKLHELAETKDGVIRAFDEQGYWVEGGSLAQYLKSTSPGSDAESAVQFIQIKRIHWIQRA
jgi:hypothetical protein